jgi:hypothetical protein
MLRVGHGEPGNFSFIIVNCFRPTQDDQLRMLRKPNLCTHNCHGLYWIARSRHGTLDCFLSLALSIVPMEAPSICRAGALALHTS